MPEFEISIRDKECEVEITGPLDESIGPILQAISKQTKAYKTIIFRMRKIDYISSLGIRSWVNFTRFYTREHKVRFKECPNEVVLQMCIIPRFLGEGTIDSFFAYQICTQCDHEIKPTDSGPRHCKFRHRRIFRANL